MTSGIASMLNASLNQNTWNSRCAYWNSTVQNWEFPWKLDAARSEKKSDESTKNVQILMSKTSSWNSKIIEWLTLKQTEVNVNVNIFVHKATSAVFYEYSFVAISYLLKFKEIHLMLYSIILQLFSIGSKWSCISSFLVEKVAFWILSQNQFQKKESNE